MFFQCHYLSEGAHLGSDRLDQIIGFNNEDERFKY